ncbi:MAG: hypothetical protein ACXACG_09795 [Candidatus Thorarchaeota archaeon]|jgi:hypothetical protein
MSERRTNIGTVLMSFGGLIILIEIVGILTGTLGGPEVLYFLGGVLEGVGIVFFLGGFVIREEYKKNRELM